MAEAKTEQEPSIEEILESIRQIISEDGEPAASTAGPSLAEVPAPRDEERTLESVQSHIQEDASEDIVLDLVDIVPNDDVIEIDLQEAKEEPITMAIEDIQPLENMAIDDASSAALLSDSTADTVSDTMAKLLAGNFAVERELPGRVGNVTLEDMARDLMRPLVKAWLDQNLPGIVEKLVAREVERISRKALDR